MCAFVVDWFLILTYGLTCLLLVWYKAKVQPGM